jgi:hypothetical protein
LRCPTCARRKIPLEMGSRQASAPSSGQGAYYPIAGSGRCRRESLTHANVAQIPGFAFFPAALALLFSKSPRMLSLNLLLAEDVIAIWEVRNVRTCRTALASSRHLSSASACNPSLRTSCNVLRGFMFSGRRTAGKRSFTSSIFSPVVRVVFVLASASAYFALSSPASRSLT